MAAERPLEWEDARTVTCGQELRGHVFLIFERQYIEIAQAAGATTNAAIAAAARRASERLRRTAAEMEARASELEAAS